MDNYLVGAECMGQSESRRESSVILEAAEDAELVEASGTKATHIYLASL